MELTRIQLDVLSSMKEGFFLWTNGIQSGNFKIWIGDDKGKVKKAVRTSTAVSLIKKDLVKMVDAEEKKSRIKYALTDVGKKCVIK